MMIVAGPERTEAAWQAGEIPRPACSAQLRPHGHARTRIAGGLGNELLTKQPRRARCAGCGRTQVLLPAALSARGPTPSKSSGPRCRPRLPAAGTGRSPPNGPAPLDSAPLVAPGAGNARPVAVRAGGAARVPPQRRHPGPTQTVAKPARLEPECVGRCRTGPPPPRRPRPVSLGPDRALHAR